MGGPQGRVMTAVYDVSEQPVQRGGLVLVVDDARLNRDLVARALTREGHEVRQATNGEQALRALQGADFDVVLLDVMMPGINGFDLCRAIKRDPSTRLIPVVLITALQAPDDRIRGIDAGADDFLTKPFNLEELQARVRSLLRIKRYTDDLDSAESVIVSLALTVEARDAYTEGHCQRLATYATAVGEALGLDATDLSALRRGGFLHDIGKIGIPDAILAKPGPLTVAEYEIMKQHTVIGDRVCGGLRSLRRVRPIVRSHHERLDGSGYPDGLCGDEIPLLAQIMSVVDLFDAARTERPYKAAKCEEFALQELSGEVDRGWKRADLVETFAGLVRNQRLPGYDALR
jgi:putative two-component system response regulator